MSLRGRDILGICCVTDKDYRTVFLFLKANGLQFHTFTNEKAAHIRLIIKGLDEESEPDEVANMLLENQPVPIDEEPVPDVVEPVPEGLNLPCLLYTSRCV